MLRSTSPHFVLRQGFGFFLLGPVVGALMAAQVVMLGASAVSASRDEVSCSGNESGQASTLGDDEKASRSEEILCLNEQRAIEAAVWEYLCEEMWWHYGVIRPRELAGRELVPLWLEKPVAVGPDRFEVAVETMAVQLKPQDFPDIGDIGKHPRLIPRTPEQAAMRRARVRGPGAWQLTFEVRRVAPGEYDIVDYGVTGRPGEPREPVCISE